MSGHVLLTVAERAGIPRFCEPVTIGVPFPRARVRDVSELSLLNPKHQPMPFQAAVLNRWPDGSVRWGLFDFQVDLEARSTREYAIQVGSGGTPSPLPRGISTEDIPNGVRIDTGAARFIAHKTDLIPHWTSAIDGSSPLDLAGIRCVLVDASGHEYRPHIGGLSVETRGMLRTTIRLDGVFSDGAQVLCQVFASISFFAASALMRLALTVRNPRPARHPHNLWDLGDPGSVYIRDLSLHVRLAERGARKVAWSLAPDTPFRDLSSEDLEIYQDSSGGQNWDSRNHVNRDNRVTTSFRGYRARYGDVCIEGRRAQPLVALYSGTRGVAAAVRDFWQNFPKSIEARGGSLIVRLFPHQSADVHELQGGEQKTHVVYLSPVQESDSLSRLAWLSAPLIPVAAPEWYATSRAIPYLTPESADPNRDYLRLINSAIEGPDSFAQKREVIDEYGWRHFGDIYADHEAVFYAGPPPVISHYNNQYDAINGAIIQLCRSGDVRWFHMMDQLASHVIDIDVYHVSDDKPAFSGGPFWHTAHYTTAFTATHRTYSCRAGRSGGGPSNEHCYTTGLMHHYFLTGHPASRQTVLDLAQWVIDIDDGRRHLLRWLDRGPTGAASRTVNGRYHGPGRGPGNAMNALLDAFTLSGERRFLDKAEALIRRCIHPEDDIETRQLLDAERRWSYTVFLQTLGRYLDLKAGIGELDARYAYAQESLRRYARWMADRERPYLSQPEMLEYPTETWSAQDMRKSDVFNFAAKHVHGPERERFLERSVYFFRSSVGELMNSKTCALTRPVVLMMTCGYMHAYCQSHPQESAPEAPLGIEFGRPERFVPRRVRVLAKLAFLAVVAGTASLALAHWAFPG